MKKLIAFAALIALLLSLGTVFAAAELPENVSFTPGKYLGGDPDAYSPVGEITVAWLPDVSDRVDMTDGDLSDWYALGLTADGRVLSAGKLRVEKKAADAALAASIFHYGENTIRQLKEDLQNRGIPMRHI